MPIYEFVCPKCGERLEKIIRIMEIPACPKCGTLTEQTWSKPAPMVWGCPRGF